MRPRSRQPARFVEKRPVVNERRGIGGPFRGPRNEEKGRNPVTFLSKASAGLMAPPSPFRLREKKFGSVDAPFLLQHGHVFGLMIL